QLSSHQLHDQRRRACNHPNPGSGRLDHMPPDDRVVTAWQSAGRLLGVDVVAPFSFRGSSGSHVCTAYLPHFGGRNGIVVMETVPPSFNVDQTVADDAALLGYRWSFINRDRYRAFDRDTFLSTLTEWGFFGPPGKRPEWWLGPVSVD